MSGLSDQRAMTQTNVHLQKAMEHMDAAKHAEVMLDTQLATEHLVLAQGEVVTALSWITKLYASL